ncbi:hypothetical protein Taro_006813, partial [Colocasia esculenta]|nr:hypothetical protein [Colocasia esculenta]
CYNDLLSERIDLLRNRSHNDSLSSRNDLLRNRSHNDSLSGRNDLLRNRSRNDLIRDHNDSSHNDFISHALNDFFMDSVQTQIAFIFQICLAPKCKVKISSDRKSCMHISESCQIDMNYYFQHVSRNTVVCTVYHKHSFMLTLSSMLTDLEDHKSPIKTNEEKISNGQNSNGSKTQTAISSTDLFKESSYKR